MKRCKPWILLFATLLLVRCYDGNGLKPPVETSGIRGTVRFTGSWPDSTKQAWVAVLKEYPTGITDTTALQMFVISNLVAYEEIPSQVEQYDYEFTLDPGTYGWILVAWFPDVSAWLLGVKQIGAYYADPENQTRPTAVTVEADLILEGIDIAADLGRIGNDFPFY